MRSNEIQLSYRSSAIEGASPIGLVVVLYDRLVIDIRAAAAAIRADDIERRCRELNHAAWILGQLEDWIDRSNGGELAENLSTFYSHLRAKLTQAAVTKSASLLEEQIELISQVRSAWQQRDSHASQEVVLPPPAQGQGVSSFSSQGERSVFSQSA
jgi:flagellar protein FliS